MPFLGKRNMSMKKHEKGHIVHIPIFLKGLQFKERSWFNFQHSMKTSTPYETNVKSN